MGKLNTKKLLRQCQAIAKQQKETSSPSPAPPEPEAPPIIEEKEMNEMDSTQLEQYLTEFLQTARDAKRRYEVAVAAEQYPNSAIQDILHAAEFAPSSLADKDIVGLLHQYRTDRRSTKQELEVTEIFQQWATENASALNKLEQVLGNMRKVLRRQPNDYYMYKTDAVAPQNTALKPDPVVEKGGEDENSELQS